MISDVQTFDALRVVGIAWSLLKLSHHKKNRYVYGQNPLVRIGFNTCLDTIFDKCLEDVNMMCRMKHYYSDAYSIRNENNMENQNSASIFVPHFRAVHISVNTTEMH